jgi:hypothetical protein
MIITAKFASTCSCCRQAISVGSKIEWSKGQPARHVACAAGSAAPVRSQSRSRHGASRGRWNGCSCGARQMPDGSLSANACDQCRYDNE